MIFRGSTARRWNPIVSVRIFIMMIIIIVIIIILLLNWSNRKA